MAIDPNSPLFKALLSMDSYNRGYLPAISGMGGVGSTLGAYTVLMDSSVLENGAQQRKDIPIGFYAVAYQYVDANNQTQTVISYRGTDEDITPLALDVVNGYGVGAGNAATLQSRMAIELYKQVAATINPGNPDPYAANISVTGHSMGGGFAGLVGAIYHKSGVLFDNMAFQTAASNLSYTNGSTSDPNNPADPLRALYSADFYQLINGTNGPVLIDGNGQRSLDPNWTGESGLYKAVFGGACCRQVLQRDVKKVFLKSGRRMGGFFVGIQNSACL